MRHLTLHEVEQRASDFLEKYNNNNVFPLPIEEIVEIELKIFVCAVPGIKSLLGIDGFISSDFSQITIDESLYDNYLNRTRFTLAHEIGHFFLHKDWYQNNGPVDLKSYHKFYDDLDNQDYGYIENQAQTFAGLILVPKDKLINEIKKRIGRIPSNESVAILQPIINDLTDFFAVSEGVIMKRMRKEGILKNSW
jgi:Zn-dependent peptidase ImmA (M78 family)